MVSSEDLTLELTESKSVLFAKGFSMNFSKGSIHTYGDYVIFTPNYKTQYKYGDGKVHKLTIQEIVNYFLDEFPELVPGFKKCLGLLKLLSNGESVYYQESCGCSGLEIDVWNSRVVSEIALQVKIYRGDWTDSKFYATLPNDVYNTCRVEPKELCYKIRKHKKLLWFTE